MTPLPLLAPIQDKESQPKHRDAFGFLSQSLEVFGPRYAGQIKTKLRKDLCDPFDDIYRAYFEIQAKLQEGIAAYNDEQFPETKRVLDAYRDERRSNEQFFQELKRRSYKILPFPQAILAHPNPDYEALEKIEQVRKRAFEVLFSNGPIDPKSQMERVQFYYGAGALISDSRPVYFHELLKLSYGRRKNACPPNLPNEEFILMIQNRNLKIRIDPNIGFKQFLVNASIQEVQSNLGLVFLDFVEEHFLKIFDNEQIRSDICYFTKSAEGFYQMDCSKLKDRPSAKHLLSLQMFLYLNRAYQLDEKTQEDLFEMIIRRDEGWNPDLFEEFANRKWENVGEKLFAWQGFDRLMNLKDPHCWPLFAVLFGNKNRGLVVKLFLLFECREDLKYLLRLYKENLWCFSGNCAPVFVEEYETVFQIVDFKDKEILFLNPPLEQNEQNTVSLGHASLRTKHFVQFMEKHGFSAKNPQFVSLLRQYILHPSGWLIEQLEENGEALGIHQFSEKFLEEIFSKSHKPLIDLAIKLLPAQQEQALKKVIDLRDRFHFSEAEVFMLYLEVIRVVACGQDEALEEALGFIQELQKFTPPLAKSVIFFLLCYRPKGGLEQLALFEERKARWMRAQRDRITVNRVELDSMILEANIFARTLAVFSEDGEAQDRFVIAFSKSIRTSFTPLLDLHQPLIDIFRITNISQDGIRWGHEAWATHLGQLKRLDDATRVYLNWSIHRKTPSLLISFVGKDGAKSARIAMETKVSDIASDEKRKPFYSFLQQLTQHFLSEKVEQKYELWGKETFSESLERLDGLRQLLDQFTYDIAMGNLGIEEIERIWNFLGKVKIAYRRLYLLKAFPIQTEDNTRIAAQGHIYSIEGEGPSLLPKEILEGVENKRHYCPDTIMAPLCKNLFSKPTESREKFGSDLQTAGGRFEVSYSVQSAEQVIQAQLTESDLKALQEWEGEQKTSEKKKKKNDLAPKEQDGTYVTLYAKDSQIPLRYPPEALKNNGLFMEYFNFHNLLLKSAIYYEMHR